MLQKHSWQEYGYLKEVDKHMKHLNILHITEEKGEDFAPTTLQLNQSR